ncbi:MAG: SCP2 sterol-binding domain-containing protein [Rhodoferax sp.]
MSTLPLLLPQPVGALLSRLPAYPGSLLFVSALNVALRPQLATDVTAMLVGKRLRLRVTDAQWAFDFEWRKDRFSATQNTGEADLTISASAYDFVLLARRLEDPDTLFFSRRLSMEGDTELGLLVKNTLDAIELPILNVESLKPAQVLSRLKARFSPAHRS